MDLAPYSVTTYQTQSKVSPFNSEYSKQFPTVNQWCFSRGRVLPADGVTKKNHSSNCGADNDSQVDALTSEFQSITFVKSSPQDRALQLIVNQCATIRAIGIPKQFP